MSFIWTTLAPGFGLLNFIVPTPPHFSAVGSNLKIVSWKTPPPEFPPKIRVRFRYLIWKHVCVSYFVTYGKDGIVERHRGQFPCSDWERVSLGPGSCSLNQELSGVSGRRPCHHQVNLQSLWRIKRVDNLIQSPPICCPSWWNVHTRGHISTC